MTAKIFTDENFQNEVIEASKSKPVLVDFHAQWCGPCKAQGPIVDELAQSLDGKAVIGKIDVDDNMNSAREYGIMGIPALKVFRNGNIVEEFTGLQQAETLQAALENHA